jgi:polyphenol oxidase
MWLQSTNIKCKHGFSTRHGGVSPAPFNSLNLGGSQDKPENILRNREIALGALKLSPANLCFLDQVHGVEVSLAVPGSNSGDALVTDDKNLVLAVSAADCYPILFYDHKKAVIGAAHAGWRGTLGGIAGNVVLAMEKLGALAQNIQVLIGPGISQQNFEVGNEVIHLFQEKGFEETCWQHNKINLIKCNLQVLLKHGVLEQNIHAMNRCTFESDFFSYRRDKGITGRMWGLISLS